MLPKSMMDCVREVVCDKGWPDAKVREFTKQEWNDFRTLLKEHVELKPVFNTSTIEPHWLRPRKEELGKITTDCKGCARLMTPNDPECKSCYKQSHYKARYTEVNIDVGFDVDIKKEMDWLAINPYIQNDIKTTVNYSKMYDERKEKDMNNGFKERAAQAVFFNKYLHRYEKIYIDKVIFNDPATIVFWNDHVKTVVKCQDGDVFDPEKGLAMAITKRFFGNQGNYCNEFQKWLPEEEEIGYVTEISVKEMVEKAKAASAELAKAFNNPFNIDRKVERAVQAAHKRMTCHTCLYINCDIGHTPCDDCVGYKNWSPANKKGE